MWLTLEMRNPEVQIHQEFHLGSMERKGFPGGTSGKENPPANARDVRDVGSISGSGRSPGGGHGNPLQYSCLENPMNRGAWRAIDYRVAKIWTPLSNLACTHACNTDKHRFHLLSPCP